MNPLGAEWGWLLHSATGGGLVLLLAWVWTRRTGQPARQQRLAEWGLAGALLVAGLSLAPAWLIVDWPMPAETIVIASAPPASDHPEPAAVENPPNAATAAGDFVPLPLNGNQVVENAREEVPYNLEGEAAPRMDPAGRSPSDLPRTQAPPVEDSHPMREAATASLTANEVLAPWPVWVGLAYSVGVCIFLGHWLLGQFALWRLLRMASPASAPVRERFEAMVGGKRARLLVSDRLRVPLSCGLLRPTIVVPRALCEPGAEKQLGWVFAHELTHLERRDACACFLFNIGRVIYFYLPWFWWLRRQVRLCQEYIADRAAAPEGEAADYAQFLLGLARAPAVPTGATGVTGNSSDLFRRITMLLKPQNSLEKRSSWPWTLAAAVTFVSLAVLLSGVGRHAYAVAGPAQEVDKKDPAKKDEPKKDDPKKDLLDPSKPLNPEDVDQLRKDIEKMQRQQMEEMTKAMKKLQEAMRARNFQGAFPPGAAGGGIALAPMNPFRGAEDGFNAFGRRPHDGRLGVLAEKPSSTLAEQLDLPKGQGLVIEEVKPDSAAAKAGIKPHDILLEINGKPVPDNPAEFAKNLADIKPDKPVDAVVLRKGKKETIKGLSLPEAKAGNEAAEFGRFGEALPGGIRIDLPNLNPPPGGPFPGGGLPALGGVAGGRMLAGPNTVMTTTFRTDDRFTTRHQEGSLIITVSGKVADGKAKTSEIQVQDGNKTEKYESVDKVPEAYRDKVKNLIEMSEKGSAKVEIKTP